MDIGIGLGVLALVLLIQGMRGYLGSHRRWIDERRYVSGWPFFGFLWMGTGIASFAVVSFVLDVSGRATPVTVALGLYFFFGTGMGWIFSLVWMPRVFLPTWARRPLEAGLDMKNVANLERWEVLVAEGWPERAAAEHVTRTAVAEGRQESGVTVNFDSEERAREFARLMASGVRLWEASSRTGGLKRIRGSLTRKTEYGFTPLHDEPDFFHPRIVVNGEPFQPAARDRVEANNHQVESDEGPRS